MRIVVLGAENGVGALIVSKALGHGHDVVAVSQGSQPAERPRLTRVRGDALDLEQVRAAVAGADAVAFAMPATGGPANAHEQGIANTVYAMAENGVPRLVALSAAGVMARDSRQLGITERLLAATLRRGAYGDLEAMERRIMASDLAWSIVRPSRLTDGEPLGDYRVSPDGSLLSRGRPVSRADVAALMLKALETDTYYRRVVVVAN